MDKTKLRNGLLIGAFALLLLTLRFGCGLKTTEEARREREQRMRSIPGSRDRTGIPNR